MFLCLPSLCLVVTVFYGSCYITFIKTTYDISFVITVADGMTVTA